MNRNHERVSHPGDRHASTGADDSQTAGRLLADVQGRWLNGSNPESVKKLVDSGVLPEGSSVIDFGQVKKHLGDDQKRLDDLNKVDNSGDKTKAGQELDSAKGVQSEAQKKLDDAQKKVDEVQGRIDKRTQLDQQIPQDYNKVSAALGKETVYASDLKTIVDDKSKPQELRDAAQRMMDTLDKNRGRSGQKIGDFADVGTWSGATYFDKSTVNAGLEKHKKENEADGKVLEPLAAARDQAKQGKDAADSTVAAKQQAVDKLGGDDRAREEEKAKLTQQIKDEQDALKPQDGLDKAGRVVSGGGYYQVAEKLLGLDKKGHSIEQERELKMLTKLLQEEARDLNGGRLPMYLKTNDQLLKPENLEHVFDKLRQRLQPAVPAPVAPPVAAQ